MVLSPEVAAIVVTNKLKVIYAVNGEPIGKGSHGVVLKARTLLNNQRVALKIIQRTYVSYNKAVHTLREIKYLSKLDHPNIMKIRNVCGLKGEPYSSICIVMDLMTCSVSRCIAQSHRYFATPRDIQEFLFQFLSGVAYLHSAQIMHRDLKPGNILCSYVPRTYKITDFDHSRKIAESSIYMTSHIGTLSHRAPELVISPTNHRSSMDVYSAGVIFLEVLTATEHYFHGDRGWHYLKILFGVIGTPDDEDLTDVDTEGERTTIRLSAGGKPRKRWIENHPEIGHTAANLLEKMLHFSPSLRCTAADALLSEYLAPVRPPGFILPEYVGETLVDYSEGKDILEVIHEISESLTIDLTPPAHELVPNE